jgi:hypothetical protein
MRRSACTSADAMSIRRGHVSDCAPEIRAQVRTPLRPNSSIRSIFGSRAPSEETRTRRARRGRCRSPGLRGTANRPRAAAVRFCARRVARRVHACIRQLFFKHLPVEIGVVVTTEFRRAAQSSSYDECRHLLRPDVHVDVKEVVGVVLLLQFTEPREIRTVDRG